MITEKQINENLELIMVAYSNGYSSGYRSALADNGLGDEPPPDGWNTESAMKRLVTILRGDG